VRAVVFDTFGSVPSVREVPDPACPPDGVVVRVKATGLCRSDWHGLAGHDPDIALPHVPGHEFAGRVAQVGEQVSGWSVGDRVTAPFVNACGECPQCRDGDHQVCSRQTQPGFSRWGSYAELVVVDRAAVNLVALPDGVDAVSAAALGCRFATAYRAVVEVGRVQLGETVAVHGCGGVGLSAVMIARAAGARVVAVDVSAASLDLAQTFGADACVQTVPGQDPIEVGALVRAETVAGVEVSIDAYGSAATCAASIACLRPRGRHVQVGLLPAVLGWPGVPMHLVVAGELAVLGSHGMSARSYPRLLAMVESGRLRPGDLVTARIGLDDAGPALAQQAPSSGVTVILP